eukprot:SM000044S16004  [mRNA]  locus=s44:507991:509090:+ [translate_table: standard]
MAIATVVTVAEILKNNGLAVDQKIATSTVEMHDEARGRTVQKAKHELVILTTVTNVNMSGYLEIVLSKSARFDELMAAAEASRALLSPGPSASRGLTPRETTPEASTDTAS